MATLQNEMGNTITVNPGDTVTMRSGNRYVMVEVPTFDWPTGAGIAPDSTTYQDIALDRIHKVAPIGTKDGDAFLALTRLSSRARSLIDASLPFAQIEAAGARLARDRYTGGTGRTSAAPAQAGTGNS